MATPSSFSSGVSLSRPSQEQSGSCHRLLATFRPNPELTDCRYPVVGSDIDGYCCLTGRELDSVKEGAIPNVEAVMKRATRFFLLAIIISVTACTPRPSGDEAEEPGSRRGASGAVTPEDYYDVLTAGSPRISPDGNWVSFTVSRRIEDYNSTRTEAWLVPADRSAEPQRLLHRGRDVSNPRWTDDGMLRYTVTRRDRSTHWERRVGEDRAMPRALRLNPRGSRAPMAAGWRYWKSCLGPSKSICLSRPSSAATWSVSTALRSIGCTSSATGRASRWPIRAPVQRRKSFFVQPMKTPARSCV